MTTAKSRENRLRRLLPRYGYRLVKGRPRYPSAGNRGLYQIVSDDNQIILGPSFDASLDDAERFLAEKQAAFRRQ